MTEFLNTKQNRVVITGMGIASPLGNTAEEYCQRLFNGEMGIRPIQDNVDLTEVNATYAAQLWPLPEPVWKNRIDKKNSSLISSVTLFVAQQAVAQSGFDSADLDTTKCGVIIGSGFHNLYDLEKTYQDFYRHGTKMATLTIPKNMSSAPATRIAINYGFQGVVSSVSSACSSGFTAIRDSVRLIQSGEQQLMITGGSDLVVCETLLMSWERMRVTSQEERPELGCRPFDKSRSGIVLGDGAVSLVLESLESALARKATILAEIKSVFQNSDSLDLVKPNPAGEITCMQTALAQADLRPDEIDLIFPHATGTRANDTIEYQAMAEVFGPHLPNTPICALKSMLGHTMGASGPMSVIAALGSLGSGFVYPVPNLEELEAGMDLRVLTAGEKRSTIKNILINTFAFGGINVSLILSKPELSLGEIL
ncbi:MAG: 3-oxoacyl-(acyl-carrier-protein) synthase [Candidatus Promineifilaceae bacterium]|jgi:3-oxoacyl-(acyl-carrier-protein) synthase